MFAQSPLILFFALAFAIAWIIWVAIALLIPDLSPGAGTFITIPGSWAPTLAALLITGRLEGREGVRSLVRGLIVWRVGVQWYFIAIFGPILIAALAVAIHVLLGGPPPAIETIAAGLNLPSEEANFLVLVIMFPIVFLMLCFGGPLAEEIGWRGFAQPRLQALIGPSLAGLTIGIIWSLWHLPLLLLVPSATGQIPLWAYLPIVTAFGVIFAWLYNRTGQSVLLCLLLHAGANTLWAFGLTTLTQDTQLMILFIILVGLATIWAYVSLARAEN